MNPRRGSCWASWRKRDAPRQHDPAFGLRELDDFQLHAVCGRLRCRLSAGAVLVRIGRASPSLVATTREKDIKVEIRHAELENLRLAARLAAGEHGDPDTDKKVIVEGNPRR